MTSATKIVTLSYNQTLFRNYSVSIFGSHTSDRASGLSIGLTVSRPLGIRRSASAQAFHENGGHNEFRMETQRSLTTGPGVGYRIGTMIDKENQFDANIVGQTDFGRYSLEGE